MNKKTFTPFERYAIWKCHEERCWLCIQPLSYRETTIDHFFPEELLEDNQRRTRILIEYGLNDETFNINGFENWLPAHTKCNQLKATKTPKFIPGYAIILENLISKAEKVKKTVLKLTENKNKDKVFLALLNALEIGVISFEDLLEFIKPIGDKKNIQFISKDLILLSGGYWIYRQNIAYEGFCKCKKNHCVESSEKLYCYFSTSQSQWVITTGLFYKCYDEIIICPRCQQKHKRGHVGKIRICGLPYLNQELQTDNLQKIPTH
ncbi:MAG: hypothetical protein WDN26_19705 [Chitinophagaceae bacterium]